MQRLDIKQCRERPTNRFNFFHQNLKTQSLGEIMKCSNAFCQSIFITIYKALKKVLILSQYHGYILFFFFFGQIMLNLPFTRLWLIFPPPDYADRMLLYSTAGLPCQCLCLWRAAGSFLYISLMVNSNTHITKFLFEFFWDCFGLWHQSLRMRCDCMTRMYYKGGWRVQKITTDSFP